MKRRRILDQFLAINKSQDNEELERFCTALFAKDDENRFVTKDLASTISLTEIL